MPFSGACVSKCVTHQSFLPLLLLLLHLHLLLSLLSASTSPLTDRFRAGLGSTTCNRTLPSACSHSLMILAHSHSQCWFNPMLMCPFCTSETKFCSTRPSTHPASVTSVVNVAFKWHHLKWERTHLCICSYIRFCLSHWARHVRATLLITRQPGCVSKNPLPLDCAFKNQY